MGLALANEVIEQAAPLSRFDMANHAENV